MSYTWQKALEKIGKKINENINKVDLKVNENIEHTTNWVNVVSKGADPSGKVDCTSIVQELLDNNTVIYFPSGCFLTTGLKLNSYNTIIGDGKNTVIKKNEYKSDSSPIIEFKLNSFLSEVRNISIEGNSMYDSNIYDAINIPDSTDTSTVYDVTHIISNVRITNVSGNGIYIGDRNRGCKIENSYVFKVGKVGINIAGTDNMITNCSTGQSGESGIVLYQNNRLVSSKTFLSGIIDKKSFGVELSKNFNNIYCLDLQQNKYGGIYVKGDSNNVNFASDGIGTDNTENNGTVSVIKLASTCMGNRLIGTINSGALNGSFNYIAFFEDKPIQVNNSIEVNLSQYSTSLIDVKYYNRQVHPSNSFIVNGEDVSYQKNPKEIKKMFAVYTGHTNYDIKVEPDNGIFSYDFPLDIKDSSKDGGCGFRTLNTDSDMINLAIENNYIYMGFNIQSNIANIKEAEYKGKIMYSTPDNSVYLSVDTIDRQKGSHKGQYNCVIDISEIKDIKMFSLVFGVFRNTNTSIESLGNTKLTVSDLYVEFVK